MLDPFRERSRISRLVTTYRKSAGHTQAELARLCGIGTLSLHHVEHGNVTEWSKSTAKVAAYLETQGTHVWDDANPAPVPKVKKPVRVKGGPRKKSKPYVIKPKNYPTQRTCQAEFTRFRSLTEFWQTAISGMAKVSVKKLHSYAWGKSVPPSPRKRAKLLVWLHKAETP